MEYNTSLPHLIIPEYGRNVQKMIDFACTVEDKEERNRVARAIIDIMGQLNPHLRDVNDFRHKLWDHLFIISDFKLDVDSPYPRPSKETFQTKPDRVNYPHDDIRFKHYGKIVEKLIAEAIAMEEGEMKDALVESIANLMKRSYMMWNRDTVSDEVIGEHLVTLSKNKLKLKEHMRLSVTVDAAPRQQTQQNNPRRNKKKQKQQGGQGGQFKRKYHQS